MLLGAAPRPSAAQRRPPAALVLSVRPQLPVPRHQEARSPLLSSFSPAVQSPPSSPPDPARRLGAADTTASASRLAPSSRPPALPSPGQPLLPRQNPAHLRSFGFRCWLEGPLLVHFSSFARYPPFCPGSPYESPPLTEPGSLLPPAQRTAVPRRCPAACFTLLASSAPGPTQALDTGRLDIEHADRDSAVMTAVTAPRNGAPILPPGRQHRPSQVTRSPNVMPTMSAAFSRLVCKSLS